MCCLKRDRHGVVGDRRRPGGLRELDHQRRRQRERAVEQVPGVRHRQRRVARGGDDVGGRRGRVVLVQAGRERAERGRRAERQRQRRRDGAAGVAGDVDAVGRAAAVGVVEAAAGQARARDRRLVAGRGRARVRRVPPLREERVELVVAGGRLVRQGLLELLLEVLLGHRAAAVGLLDVVQDAVVVVLAEDRAQGEVRRARTHVGVRVAVHRHRRRVRRRDVPERRRRRVVVGGEAAHEAGLERRVAGRGALAADRVGRDQRRCCSTARSSPGPP